MLKSFQKFAVVSLLSFFAFAPKSHAFTALPDPSTTVDGLPVAIPYDEFLSYSTQLLTQFGFSGFNGPSGVGGLDIVLTTGSGGTDNDPVAGGFVFEDPIPSANGGTSSFSGTWGQGDRPNGPVLVDDLLDYLHFNFGATQNIPVFTFDLAEPGNVATRDLQMLAKFSIFDPVNNVEVESWALDNTPNGVFDPASFLTVQGEISLTGLSNTVYTATNTGSGKYDFLVFSPTMNLSNYTGNGYEFHIFSEFRNLNGSHEEAFISGAFTVPTRPEVPVNTPEPVTSALLGISGILYGFQKLSRKK